MSKIIGAFVGSLSNRIEQEIPNEPNTDETLAKKIIGVTVGTPISPAKIEEEIKPIKRINGIEPDDNGNVEVSGGSVATVTKTVSGVGSIMIDDVSPIGHNVVVTLENKNLLNNHTVNGNEAKYGITLTENGDGTYTIKGTARENVSFYIHVSSENPLYLKKGVTYTISGNIPDKVGVYVYRQDWKEMHGATYKESQTFTIEDDSQPFGSHIYITNGTTVDGVIKPMLEVSDTATEFVPNTDISTSFVSVWGENGEAEAYFPNEEGIISDVKSLSPIMQFQAYPRVFIITATYERDLNKVIADLEEQQSEVIQGEKGEKGDKGDKGEDGADGKDGTSVTVENVSESSDDGGSNVVTFSDGTTLTVKNGSKGSQGEKGDKGDTGAQGIQGEKGADGYTPIKGVDYFDGKNGADGKDGANGKDGAKGADGTSVTVSSVKESTVDGGSNVVTFSDGKTLTVKNGSKGRDGIDGNDGTNGVSPTISVEADDEGYVITVFDAVHGEKFYILKHGKNGADGERGTGILPTTTGIASYTTTVNGIKPTYRIAISTLKTQSGVSEVIVGDEVRYSYYLYPVLYVDADYAYLGTRVSIRGATGSAGKDGADGADGADGKDYVLTEADKAEIASMVNSSAVIPEYWQSELEAKADAIQQAMETAGKNKSAFLWYTDAHWVNGNSKMSPKLLNYLYMNTPMNKVNFGGDIIGDTLLATREEMKYLYEWRKAIKDLPNHHSVFGNHDMFNLDTVDYEDDNYRYAFLLAPEETPDQVWGDGNYYYIDNLAEKTRYLYIAYLVGDGEAMMKQGQFICDAIKAVPEGWHIVAIAHRWWQYSKSSTPTTGAISDYEADMLSVFDAYNARATRSGSNYFYAQDFTQAKGKVEFCIGGHIHVDYDIESEGGIPIIITTSDTNQNRVPDSTVDSGTVGTITESAVFGIIADYNDSNNTKITVVGVGRGTSRVIRPSGIKPASITNITYSGDTTVGATIDKSKFSFTVEYSNGTTDTVNGATSVSPATIGVVGDNTVTITYTEGTTTLNGTATIVGTAVPVVNLLNLDRAYVTGTVGESIGMSYPSYLDESKAYTNTVQGTNAFNASACTVSGISEDGATVKESGIGGITVAYPVYLPNFGAESYKLSFDYTGDGSSRVWYKPFTSIGNTDGNFTIVNTTGSGHIDYIIPASAGFVWIVIFVGANTGKTTTISNVSLTKVE